MYKLQRLNSVRRTFLAIFLIISSALPASSQQYQLLDNSSLPRRPALFLHIHKAAGTVMCALAHANHERTYPLYSSCGWEPYDGYRFHTEHTLAPEEDGISCDLREQHIQKYNVTWQQLEHAIGIGDYCPHAIIYAIMVRDPIETMESYLNYQDADAMFWPKALCVPGSVETYIRMKACFMEGNVTSCVHDAACPPVMRVHTHFDNFMVRLLGGETVMRLLPMRVKAKHTRLAMRMLSRFQTVLRLEDIGKAAFRERLHSDFGWNDFRALEHQVRPNHHVLELPVADKAFLRELNRQDYALYNSIPPTK